MGGFTKVAEDAATEPGTAQGHRGERNENRLLQWRQRRAGIGEWSLRDVASGPGVVRGALTVAYSLPAVARAATTIVKEGGSLHFGVGVGTPQTLNEIGTVFGLTRERIRQVEAAALSRLAYGRLAKYRAGFVDA